MTDTPILFIIFNRPDTTKTVFAEIRKAKPNRLFIAADGPRQNKPGEKEKCEETRRITEKIDWPCEVERLYREKNLGCKFGVSSAITWFFENVKLGIILEDDCSPDQSFFKFCSTLLEKYEGDKETMMISGDNFHKNILIKSSYYFSRYPHIWGWATWRRAWKKYNVRIPKVPLMSKTNTPNNIFIERLYWNSIFNRVHKNQIDTWDYQWVYAIFKNNGKIICPKINLVENIGFGENATHTKTGNVTKRKGISFPLLHPKQTSVDTKLDINEFKKNQNINILTVGYSLIKSIF